MVISAHGLRLHPTSLDPRLHDSVLLKPTFKEAPPLSEEVDLFPIQVGHSGLPEAVEVPFGELVLAAGIGHPIDEPIELLSELVERVVVPIAVAVVEVVKAGHVGSVID